MNGAITKRICALLLFSAAFFPRAVAAQSPAGQAKPPAAAAQSAADAQEAEKLFASGVQAEQEELWNTAFALFSQAAEKAPANAEYAARREQAKFRLVQQHVDRAELLAVQNQLEDARNELRLALSLDPKYRVARERLAQLSQRTFRELGRKSEYDAEPVALKPRAGKRTFDFRGTTLGAFEEIGRQCGLTAAFDQDFASKQVRFRIANVDCDRALELLQQQTDSFIRPIDEKTFLALQDTPEKRQQYAPRITRMVQLSEATSQEELAEIRQMSRDIAGISNPQLNASTRQLVLRGEPQSVALAMEMIREMEQARGEIMLEVNFLEVDRNRSRTLGITPPTSGKIFTLTPADVREAHQSTEALLRVIQRVFGSASSTGLSQEELAARLASGQVGVASLLPPLIAFGGGRTIFLSTLPGAAADFAETLSLVRRARRLLLRAEDGQPASFFVGDRVPISYSVLTPGTTGSQVIPGIKKTDFATDLGPTSVAVGDFNGDGKADITTANSASNTISILLNTGTGDFGVKTDIVVGSQPRAVIARDFDGDGKLDLAVAVANSTSNTVEILKGDGAGGFSPVASLLAGVTPIALASADFNGDSILDLAVVNSGDNSVSLFQGNGDGTFVFSGSLSTGVSPSAIDVADFDGDGAPDLVVTNSGDASVTIYPGLGNGLFNTGVSLQTGTNPVGVVAGNFNTGGNISIAVVNQGSNSVSVFVGNGDGTFVSRTDFATGAQPVAISAEDFTGDNVLDLAVANSGASTISILAGQGNANFAGTEFASPAAPFALATADFDVDGKVDLVSANRDANTVTVFLNQSSVLPAANAAQQAYPAVQYEDLGVKARATPRLHANGEVTLKLQFELRSFADSNFNGIPVITNRTVEQTVRLKENEPAVLAGILQQDIEQTASGWPGAVSLPGPGQTGSKRQGLRRETELIIVITPRRIRQALRKDRTIYAGGKDSGAPASAAPERPPQ